MSDRRGERRRREKVISLGSPRTTRPWDARYDVSSAGAGRLRYRHFNKRVYVCRNGIDLARDELIRPPRDTVNIGWAGATGHATAIQPWIDAVGEVMEEFPRTTFVSIGQPYAEAFVPYFGPARAIAIPFAAVEQYPAAGRSSMA